MLNKEMMLISPKDMTLTFYLWKDESLSEEDVVSLSILNGGQAEDLATSFGYGPEKIVLPYKSPYVDIRILTAGNVNDYEITTAPHADYVTEARAWAFSSVKPGTVFHITALV